MVLRSPKPNPWGRRRDPEVAADALNHRFRNVSRRWDRSARVRRVLRRMPQRIGIVVGLVLLAAAGLSLSPWPPLLTLQHIAAAPNCSAARAVGLAPARRGEPGYYAKHDRDKDGWACEPWPPVRPKDDQ